VPSDATVIASGFSCREQIEQLTGHKTRHLSEVMAEAMGVLPPPAPPSRGLGRQLAIAGGILAGGFLLAALTSHAAAGYSAGSGKRRELRPLSSAAAAPAPSPIPAHSQPR
jgi:hypothetical protein